MKKYSLKIICFLLTAVMVVPIFSISATSAPPPSPETYETTLESDTSVYVSSVDYEKTTNFDSGADKYHLTVGGDEYEYRYISYVKFGFAHLLFVVQNCTIINNIKDYCK